MTNLLSPGTMNSNIFLHFVGYEGEFDVLYQKTMRSKSADVFGRSWVIYQWLLVLQVVNPFYQNLQLPSFFQFKNRFKSATAHLLAESLSTFDDNERMENNAGLKDDIAGVRASTNVHMQASHDSSQFSEENSNDTSGFALKHCYLANANKTSHNIDTNLSHVYFANAAKAMGVNIDQEKEQYNRAKLFRSQHPINEFTDGEYGLVAAFPQIFLFGKAYKKMSII